MRRRPDIELIRKIRVVMAVCRLYHGVIGTGLLELVVNEGVPDKNIFTVPKLAVMGIEQNQRRIEAIAVSGGAQVENPAFPLFHVKHKKIEITVNVQAAVYSHGQRNFLRLLET